MAIYPVQYTRKRKISFYLGSNHPRWRHTYKVHNVLCHVLDSNRSWLETLRHLIFLDLGTLDDNCQVPDYMHWLFWRQLHLKNTLPSWHRCRCLVVVFNYCVVLNRIAIKCSGILTSCNTHLIHWISHRDSVKCFPRREWQNSILFSKRALLQADFCV